LTAYSFPISNANQEQLVKGQHTGARLAIHVKEVLNGFELTNGRSLRMMADNAFSKYSMTRELQLTLQASGILGPDMRNHIPCMAHVIQLALGAFMSNLGVVAAPSLGNSVSAISNLERMQAQTLERVKTASRGQCQNPEGVGCATRFGNDN